MKKRAMKKSREGKKSGSKEHEQTRSSTDGGETATETETATEIETNVVRDEWMMRRAVTIRAVIGKNFFAARSKNINFFCYYILPKENDIQVNRKNDHSNENVVETPDTEVEVDHEIGIIETKIVTDAIVEIKVSDNVLSYTSFKIGVTVSFES